MLSKKPEGMGVEALSAPFPSRSGAILCRVQRSKPVSIVVTESQGAELPGGTGAFTASLTVSLITNCHHSPPQGLRPQPPSLKPSPDQLQSHFPVTSQRLAVW